MTYKLKELFERSATAAQYVSNAQGHMARLVERIDADAVARIIGIVEPVAEEGRSVFVIANGGSAAVASHFVNDLGVNCLVDGYPGWRVFCLADNVASVTAVANDRCYEDVFLRQLECTMAPGDLVLAMSVSGNSENIVRAVQFANDRGGCTIGLCGFDGGRLAQTAQHVVHIESSKDEYGPVEDAFSVICHLVSGYLSMRRGRFLHH